VKRQVDDCESYDGVPTYGGPCWTCQNKGEHCPLEQEYDVWRAYVARERKEMWDDLRNPWVWAAIIAFFVFVGLIGWVTGYP
jgi:hypothetical protein